MTGVFLFVYLSFNSSLHSITAGICALDAYSSLSPNQGRVDPWRYARTLHFFMT